MCLCLVFMFIYFKVSRLCPKFFFSIFFLFLLLLLLRHRRLHYHLILLLHHSVLVPVSCSIGRWFCSLPLWRSRRGLIGERAFVDGSIFLYLGLLEVWIPDRSRKTEGYERDQKSLNSMFRFAFDVTSVSSFCIPFGFSFFQRLGLWYFRFHK